MPPGIASAVFLVALILSPVARCFPPEELLHSIHTDAVQGRASRSNARLQPLIEQFPDDLGVLSLAGMLADLQNDTTTAVSYYQRALMLNEHNPQLLMAMASMMLKKGEFYSAATYLETIQQHPQSAIEDRNAAMHMYSQKLPMTMLQAGMAHLTSLVDPVGNIHLFVGAVRYSPQIYSQALPQIMSKVVYAANVMIGDCRMETVINLLTSWGRLAPRGIGMALTQFLPLAQALQILGRHEEAKQSASSGVQLCRSEGVDGRHPLWKNCANLYQMLRDYHTSFKLIRDAHQAHRVTSQQSVHPSSEGRGMTNEPVFNVMRLQHDIEQIRYLEDVGRLSLSSEEVEELVGTYAEALQVVRSSKQMILSVNDLQPPLRQRMAAVFDRPLYMPKEEGTPWKERRALNPSQDFKKMSRDFMNGEVVVIDNFLTMPALQALKEVGLEAQFWHATRLNNYVGAMDDDGFGPDVLARLANELEEAMPDVFDGHTLLMHWGFKHDTELGPHGIAAHADTAAVNLNFWVTDDHANLDDKSGGLVVFDKRSTHNISDSSLGDYNHFGTNSTTLGLTKDNIKNRVPHRQNRAVLFHSSYFHETDVHKFKNGYQNRRINYTLLFGRMESIRCPSGNFRMKD